MCRDFGRPGSTLLSFFLLPPTHFFSSKKVVISRIQSFLFHFSLEKRSLKIPRPQLTKDSNSAVLTVFLLQNCFKQPSSNSSAVPGNNEQKIDKKTCPFAIPTYLHRYTVLASGHGGCLAK